MTAGVAPSGPYVIKGVDAARRRAAGRQGHPGVHRRRQRLAGARVPVAGQGPVARADHRRGRLRPATPPRTAPRCTTRTSRSRPSSSACRAGERSSTARAYRMRPAGVEPHGRLPSPRRDGRERVARAGPSAHGRRARTRTGSTCRRRSSSASSSSCRRLLAFFYSLTRWTLFDDRVHRARQLRPVLPRAGADQRPAQHVHLRRRHQRPEGRPRAAAGDAAHLADPARATCSARSIFFPVLVSTVAVGITFAVLMHPSDRPDQHGRSSVVGHRRAAVADRPAASRCSRSRSSTSGRASGIALVIFIAGILSIPEEYFEAVAARRRRPGSSSATSSCRSAGTRRSR